MKILIKIITLSFLSFSSFCTEYDDVMLNNMSSSTPPHFKEATLGIPANFNSSFNIRVLIFPHTLKNDWRHGKPDNPRQFRILSKEPVTLFSENMTIQVTNAVVKLDGEEIVVESNKKKYKFESSFTFNAETPLKIERLGNEKQSNSYIGKFKVRVSKNELNIINTVTLEEYLLGVVPSESISSWPLDALKAQALAARSYAAYHIINALNLKSPEWDVDDTARYQVYTGVSHRKPSTDKAVLETAGELITYNKKVIVAFFHSYSGGYTDSAKNIFGIDSAPYCDRSKEIFTREHLKENINPTSHWIVEWRKTWNKKEIISKLKTHNDTRESFKEFEVENNLNFSVIDRNINFESIRNMALTQNSNTRPTYFRSFRAALGWSNFKGYHYYIDDEDNSSLTLRGYGWGHHVGMSQWGAFMMSKYFNFNYKNIIKHYYKDVEILKI